MFKYLVTIASVCVILGAGYFGVSEYRAYKNQQAFVENMRANAVDSCVVRSFDKRSEYRLKLIKYGKKAWMYFATERNKLVMTEIDKPALQEAIADDCQVLDQDMERTVELVKTIAQSNLNWLDKQ